MRAFLLSTVLIALGGCSDIEFDQSNQEKIYITDEKLVIANQYHGLDENRNRTELKQFLGVDPVHVEWCAAFVNSVLWGAGIPDTDSLLARSYLKWGNSVDIPEKGDIMVFSRGSQAWMGHVGFYAGTVKWKEKDYWVVLGGNQNNTVSYQLFPVNSHRLLDIRRYEESEVQVTLSTKNWQADGVPIEFAD